MDNRGAGSDAGVGASWLSVITAKGGESIDDVGDIADDERT